MNMATNFVSKFNFQPDLAYHVGVEREFFITSDRGEIVPEAKRTLDMITNPLPGAGTYGYELSACQIESQSLPAANANEVRERQTNLDGELDRTLSRLKLRRLCLEVAPDDMSLAVYPDPANRYQSISKSMPKEVLLAACQVTGTHFHVGMPSPEVALRVYNRVIEHSEELCQMGDRSNGKRLELYKLVAPNYQPVQHESWTAFELHARENGYFMNPRDCWHMIRISIHGTIEFRNFGVTDSIDEIVNWSEYCRDLCLRYS